MHRKSSSLHIDASTATGWLAELGEQGRGFGEVSNYSLCSESGEGKGVTRVSTPCGGVECIVVLTNVPFPCGDIRIAVLLRK